MLKIQDEKIAISQKLTDSDLQDNEREIWMLHRRLMTRFNDNLKDGCFKLPVVNLPANNFGQPQLSTSAFNLSSFEIHLYDRVPIPMTPVPVRNYKFGAAATPALIRLGDYGIVGLKDNIFHFSEYIDDHGMVSQLDHGDCRSFIEERHITCTSHLHMYSLLH